MLDTPRVRRDEFQTRATPAGVVGDRAARQRFFDQHAAAARMRLLDDAERFADHPTFNVVITTSQTSTACIPPATVLCDMPNARINPSCFICASACSVPRCVDDVDVVAVGVDQHHVEVIGGESLQ